MEKLRQLSVLIGVNSRAALVKIAVYEVATGRFARRAPEWVAQSTLDRADEELANSKDGRLNFLATPGWLGHLEELRTQYGGVTRSAAMRQAILAFASHVIEQYKDSSTPTT